MFDTAYDVEWVLFYGGCVSAVALILMVVVIRQWFKLRGK